MLFSFIVPFVARSCGKGKCVPAANVHITYKNRIAHTTIALFTYILYYEHHFVYYATKRAHIGHLVDCYTRSLFDTFQTYQAEYNYMVQHIKGRTRNNAPSTRRVYLLTSAAPHYHILTFKISTCR